MADFLALDTHDRTPIYVQLDRAIRAAVATGRFARGVQLPTVRQLAVALRVNANTVARVYADLERSGVVETRRGVGTFVAEHQPAAAPRRGREAELRAFVQQWLGEAAARGFSHDDVVRQLKRLAEGQGG